MAKFMENAQVISQKEISEGIFDLVLKTENIAGDARAGQFVSVYTADGAHLLPRPISLCDVDKEAGTIRLVYRVVGFGTTEFSGLKEGDTVRILGPLGNGYDLSAKKALVMGGGIGIPPLLQLSKKLSHTGMKKEDIQVVLGFRDVCFLDDEFEKYGNVYIATEDGSKGTAGNVLNAVAENDLKADVIYACGPTPMLRAIKAYALENDIECYLSLEEKMACGIGACLGCVCQSTDVDEHSHVHNKRVCADGPVFNAKEIEL